MGTKTKLCRHCNRRLPLDRFGLCGFAKANRKHKCNECLGEMRGQEKQYSDGSRWADATYRGLKIRGRDF